MNPLRSVGARLSLAVLLVVAGALAIVYAVVVPSLERNLVDAKLDQLQAAATSLARRTPEDPFAWPDFVENAAASANARVVIFDAFLAAPTPALAVAYDSNALSSVDVQGDPIAFRAAIGSGVKRGTIERSGQQFAEVAVPLALEGPVLLLSAPLDDTLGSVDLVRTRVLLAGVLALLISLAVGYGAAWFFARRLRRLERAAERIAAGDFDEPVTDPGRDEVGELAAAFDRMRLRLSQLDHARREFIANASHELRTPLFSLGGFIELLADEEIDPDTRREFLETMGEQVDRLAKLATDLLDLSRMDAGRLRVEAEPIALGEIARGLVEEFEPLARARNHPVVASIEGSPNAVADEQRTLQIGRILLENALLHTPEGTPVRALARADNGRVELAVVDEGPGIPAEHADQIFERFYRVEGTRASGSGLGLAIARELAELMGGEIELASRPGETRFALVLPAASPDARDGAPADAEVVEAASTTQ